jgi:hypothetical protein
MSTLQTRLPCPGCRGLFPDTDGPTHAYLGASPGCWAVYCHILAKEYGEYGYPDVHRLTVDAYAVQHPGEPSRRSIQSVAVHLVSLYFVLERGLNAQMATNAIREALKHNERFVWLTPPVSPGTLTVLDVVRAENPDAHNAVVERWARCVWAAWDVHHATVRGWADAAI